MSILTMILLAIGAAVIIGGSVAFYVIKLHSNKKV